MDMFDYGTAAGLSVTAAMLFLFAWAWAARNRRVSKKPKAVSGDTPEGTRQTRTETRKSDARIAALETLQADLAARIDALVSAQNEPEERLQTLASQILSLIRDKNATLETALAGLDQLRARMRTLEQIGDLAETRELLDTISGRLDALQSSSSADMAGFGRRLEQLEAPGENPFGEISAQLTQLYAQKDTAIEAVLNRVGPLERRLADIDGEAPLRESMLEQIRSGIADLQSVQDEHREVLDELSVGARDTRALSDGIAALRAQKTEMVAGLTARLEALEQTVTERDPNEVLKRVTDRIDELREMQTASETSLKDRVSALENPTESPFSEISAQLTSLYSQKDAIVETVFARIAPLEAKLADLSDQSGAQEMQALIHRVSERLEALREMQAASEVSLKERVSALEHPAESPFSEISAQLTQLYDQKDAIVETVFSRIAPLEAKLADLSDQSGAQEMQALIHRVSERLEALREMQAASEVSLKDRVSALEHPAETPFSEISTQLTQLYAQKDAAVETVFARLQPLEAKLGRMQEALARVDTRQGVAELKDLVAHLDSRQTSGEADMRRNIEEIAEAQAAARSDFAALRAEAISVDIIAQRLEGLHAQKDVLSEALMVRMQQVEDMMAASDPRALLDSFAQRLDVLHAKHAASETALKDRISALENPAESHFAEISAQLTQLYAQKDATVETIFARLQPLEAKLSTLEAGLGRAVQADQIESFTTRLDGLDWAQDELAERVGGVESAAVAKAQDTVAARVSSVEAKIATLVADFAAQDPRAVLDRFSERLVALRDRVSALENPSETPFAEISAQLTQLYAQKDATVETVFARLQPLETKLSTLEAGLGRAVQADQIESFTTRLDGLDWAQDELVERMGGVESAAVAKARDAVSGQFVSMRAQLAEMEGQVAAQDPRAVLDRFSERLDALGEVLAASEATLKDRVVALENPDTTPLSDMADQLAQLYAEKDIPLEMLSARLAPLEAKLEELETGLGGAVGPEQWGGLTSRLDALADAQENTSEQLTAIGIKAAQAVPVAEIRKELTQALAGRDANIDALLKRLAPLENRLAELESRPWDPDADEARAQAQEVAMQLIAARAAAQHTELFADRLALLEATLPRLSATQTRLMQTLERKGEVTEMTGHLAAAQDLSAELAETDGNAAILDVETDPEASQTEPEVDLDVVQAMPRVISLHQK